MSAALLEALGSRGEVLVTLDFETYYDSDYTLRKLTTEAYVRDERFEVLGVGVRVGSAPTVWLEEWDFRAWAATVDWSRVAALAHHAQFDGLVLSERYAIRPRFWLDTLSMARALHGASRADLDSLARRYQVGRKGDQLAGVKGKHRRDLTQAEWEAFGEYCRNDVDLTRELARKMLLRFPKLELWAIDTTVRCFTEPGFRGDMPVLVKALQHERERKAVLLDQVLAQHAGATSQEEARASLASNEKFAAILTGLGVEPPTKISPKTGETIYAFAKSDSGMAELLDHPRDEVRFIAEARLAVKSTIVETRVERMIGIAQRGPIPIYLKYSGAHTHRWAGGDKMNPQNFNRGGVLRAALLAALGHTLAVVDSSQIEARVLAWLAGEESLLETFRRNDATGGDFYSDVGSQFFQKKISKKETPTERQLSKNMVLGLGFSMGWAKFALELLKGMLGSEPVQFTYVEAAKFNVNVAEFEARQFGPSTCGDRVRELVSRLDYAALLVHCAVADYFVRRYRETYPRIVALWKACERLLEVMASPGEGDGDRLVFRKLLTVRRHELVKPSGLALHYPGLKRTADGYRYLGGKSGREMVKAYGGLITENLVQSLARDIITEQALWIRADGHRIGTLTHDEVVGLVPLAGGDAALASMLARLRQAPEWATGLPLNADGGVGESYGDAK